MAIWEIFSVKEWPDLKIWVWGRSRSLKWRRSIDQAYDFNFLLIGHCNYSLYIVLFLSYLALNKL